MDTSGNTRVQDMRSALAILEKIHFLVGPELLRKDVTKAIQHLKHGLEVDEACSQARSLLKEGVVFDV